MLKYLGTITAVDGGAGLYHSGPPRRWSAGDLSHATALLSHLRSGWSKLPPPLRSGERPLPLKHKSDLPLYRQSLSPDGSPCSGTAAAAIRHGGPRNRVFPTKLLLSGCRVGFPAGGSSIFRSSDPQDPALPPGCCCTPSPKPCVSGVRVPACSPFLSSAVGVGCGMNPGKRVNGRGARSLSLGEKKITPAGSPAGPTFSPV